MINTFHSVLIIDDKGLEDPAVRQLVSGLSKTFHYSVVVGPDEVSTETMEERVAGIDLVVVDWNLNKADDGRTALAWIGFFHDRGTPTVVYTGEKEVAPIQEACDGAIAPNAARVFTKIDAAVSANEIANHVMGTADLATRVGLVWKPATRQATFDTLQSLRALSSESLQMIIRSAGHDSLDLAETLTELYTEVLSTTLNPNADRIRDILGQLYPTTQVVHVNGQPQPAPDATQVADSVTHLEALLKTLMYDSIPKRRTDTGDIIDLGNNKYGVVLTPRCDMVKCLVDAPVTYIEALPLKTFLQKLTNDEARQGYITDTWPQPDFRVTLFALYNIPIGGQSLDLVVTYNVVNTVRYDQTTKRLARIRSPYFDSLVHAFAKFVLRYGMPSFPYRRDEGKKLFTSLMVEKLRKVMAAP